MKLMTLNIWNYERDWPKRCAGIAHMIEEHQPDAVALQETRHDFRFAHGLGQGEQIAAVCGYAATSAIAQVYVPVLRVDEGLTILTPTAPLRTVCTDLSLLPDERADENHRICLGVEIEIAGTAVWVFDTHFSLSERARRQNAVEVAAFVAREAGERPAIVMGDLNAEPDETCIRFLTGETDMADHHAGFVDCWTASPDAGSGYTYPSWKPVKRIDYALGLGLPAPSRATIVGLEPYDGVYLSDHAGILVEIVL